MEHLSREVIMSLCVGDVLIDFVVVSMNKIEYKIRFIVRISIYSILGVDHHFHRILCQFHCSFDIYS